MSSIFNRKRFTNKRIAIGSTVASALVVGGIVLAVAAPSGELFNAEQPIHAGIGVATLSMSTSDANDVGSVNLQFTNLKPMSGQTEQFTVTNTGSIQGDLNLGSTIDNAVYPANVSSLDLNYLRFAVWDTSVGQTVGAVPIDQLPAGGTDLGEIQPGQTRSFTILFKLDGNAGNDWQGAQFGGDLPLTLTQN